MGRPEILTIDVREFIFRIKSINPAMKAKDVIAEVKEYLIDSYPTPNGNWTRNEIEKLVEDEMLSESAIIKYLTKIKKPELDRPWRLGLMAERDGNGHIKHPEYSIPSEATPYILLVQDWLEKHPDWLNNPPPQEPLTIRQALWVARLYGLIDESRLKKSKLLPSIARFLFIWAEAYAMREAICELAGTSFDTTTLDKGLYELGEPVTAGKTTLIHYRDKSLTIDTIDEDLLRQMEEIEKEGEK